MEKFNEHEFSTLFNQALVEREAGNPARFIATVACLGFLLREDGKDARCLEALEQFSVEQLTEGRDLLNKAAHDLEPMRKVVAAFDELIASKAA